MNIKRMKLAGWAIVAVAILASLLLWGQRISSEQNYKNVQMVVNYSDIEALANANHISAESLGKELKDRGVTAILYKELSLGDLANDGRVSLNLGYNIKNQAFFNQVASNLPINNATMYVALMDGTLEKQISENVLAKVVGAEYYPGQIGVITLPVMVPNGDGDVSTINTKVKAIGVGFDETAITAMADLGFETVPQLRSWEKPTHASLRMVADEIKNMPNLAYLLFNDKEVPGYPSDIRTFADLLKDSDGKELIAIGTIEFSDQKGLNTLGVLLNKNVVRLHTITNSEMGKFTEASATDRWMLAVRERNMRSLLVRFFDISAPATSLQRNLDYVEALQREISDAGFNLNGGHEKPDAIQAGWLLYIVGIGIAAGVMLLLLELRLPKLAIVSLVIVAGCWVGLLQFNPITARKLMALVSVIVFPTLSCLIMLKPKRKTLLYAIGALVGMCALSYIGAILMVGMLADVLFMLKLDQFSGVKIAHIIPILIVPVVLFIWNTEKPLSTLKELLAKTLNYKWTVLFAVIAVAGIVYISRTGNTTAELSSGEAWMRNFLNTVLGVRPRTKEFLIGYPCTILLFWLGAKKENWIFTIPAVIGQVSLVNTYAHIHTPLLISLQRSAEGLVIGIVVGAIVVLATSLLLWGYNKLEEKEGER